MSSRCSFWDRELKQHSALQLHELRIGLDQGGFETPARDEAATLVQQGDRLIRALWCY